MKPYEKEIEEVLQKAKDIREKADYLQDKYQQEKIIHAYNVLEEKMNATKIDEFKLYQAQKGVEMLEELAQIPKQDLKISIQDLSLDHLREEYHQNLKTIQTELHEKIEQIRSYQWPNQEAFQKEERKLTIVYTSMAADAKKEYDQKVAQTKDYLTLVSKALDEVKKEQRMVKKEEIKKHVKENKMYQKYEYFKDLYKAYQTKRKEKKEYIAQHGKEKYKAKIQNIKMVKKQQKIIDKQKEHKLKNLKINSKFKEMDWKNNKEAYEARAANLKMKEKVKDFNEAMANKFKEVNESTKMYKEQQKQKTVEVSPKKAL